MKDFVFIFLLILFSFRVSAQKNNTFSGELTYDIERVDKKDSIRSVMVIFAKDSLLKVVNFTSNSERQELIKHLRLNKSFLLIKTIQQNFAIRTNEHLISDNKENYTFRKRRGKKIIAGISVKKVIVKHTEISDKLTFYYAENIPAKYANIYKNLPGLPILFYVPTEDGLFKYVLRELKNTDPPLDLFIVPKNYKIVSFEEFTDQFSKLQNENEEK